ncbi:Rho GTPase activation protein [Piedraia hortae CBS 480.64]|uniref:Rho GTPase activation protein n=1 Tax=Piedraia hortae CBS 480.64 TaxID=1314780 RepID=A0A6A7C0M3_9PEZI|nr:Rho GTPase activation protein [Piedraia hortae CBS 480.64]
MPPPDSGLLKTKRGERRGKSVERIAGKEEEQHQHQHQPADGARGRAHSNQRAKDKERGGGLFTGSKNVVSKATKGGGNFLVRLGKMGRSSSNAEKEVPDSEYQLKVINRPLAEQARITRISKDLSSCRDKTEYWMPSLPWRCIDYLNSNCESEGLYRIPGGVLQVRHWQRRFDQELDIDLLDEKDLYDPNEIGSVLKKWLTDLPTEMMPLSLQQSLAAELEQENPDFKNIGQPAPQRLRDVLSELPPFNYYLLFAVTCHLSLLLSNQDKNKMDLHNLNICIGPCLKLERWLFNYLVGDWRHCWQGCFTEKQYLEAEKALEQNKILRSNSSPATSRTGSQAPVGSDESVDSSADRVSEDTRDARPRAENKRLVDAFKTRGQQQRDPSPRDRRLPALTARPTTSDCDSEFDTVRGLPSDITRPPLVTRNTHSRSKSDVPPTPSKVAGYPGGDSWFNLPSR